MILCLKTINQEDRIRLGEKDDTLSTALIHAASRLGDHTY